MNPQVIWQYSSDYGEFETFALPLAPPGKQAIPSNVGVRQQIRSSCPEGPFSPLEEHPIISTALGAAMRPASGPLEKTNLNRLS